MKLTERLADAGLECRVELPPRQESLVETSPSTKCGSRVWLLKRKVKDIYMALSTIKEKQGSLKF